MRCPEYLSPSGISKWVESVETYYLQYLADDRPPRDPQNKPMAIGSAFDAYVKSYLHDKLFGQNHCDSNRFALSAIFEAQVESHNRDWAINHGKHCFNIYQSSGALQDLLMDLLGSKVDPRFEFELKGQVGDQRESTEITVEGGMVLLGKPDAYYVNKEGVHVLLDWKVNGYFANHAVSPKPGYVRLRGANGYNQGMHKRCKPLEVGGLTINCDMTLEELDDSWARQLSIYGWLCGEPIGGDFIVAIDQLACKAPGLSVPEIRIAEHRLRVSKEFQKKTYYLARDIWDTIHSNHIFRNMTLEHSQGRCELLDRQAKDMYGENADPVWTMLTK